MKKSQHIFIHIAKTAGGSISSIMKQNGIAIDPTNQKPNDKEYLDLEYSWHDFRNFNLHEFDFSFAFVRNTYDRLVSAFHTPWVNPTAPDHKDQEVIAPKEFSDFVKNFVLREKSYDFFRWSHVMPYFDERSKLFDSDGNQRVSFIGEFENLQEDFDFACKQMNIPVVILPHEHKSERIHYTEYYDNQTREIVAEKYAKDIEYFGYKFGE